MKEERLVGREICYIKGAFKPGFVELKGPASPLPFPTNSRWNEWAPNDFYAFRKKYLKSLRGKYASTIERNVEDVGPFSFRSLIILFNCSISFLSIMWISLGRLSPRLKDSSMYCLVIKKRKNGFIRGAIFHYIWMAR